MKYIKKYEQLTEEPEIGDYIIADIKINYQGYFDETLEYIKTHIGKIVSISKRRYKIYYDFFPFTLDDDDYVILQREDIECFSKDKDILMNMKNFNL